MHSHAEIELKWALCAGDYPLLLARLQALLGSGQRLDQENLFFDSADGRLRRARMSLRLRRENQRLLLTCKARGAKNAAGDGLHQSIEHEQVLSLVCWAHLTGGEPLTHWCSLPPLAVQALAGAALIGLGGFANLRHAFAVPDIGELLCLDRTNFGTRTDYELEIETSDPAGSAERWGGRLRDWGISWQPLGITKLERYLTLAQQTATG